MATSSEAESGSAPLGRVLGVQRDFTLLWSGQVISSLGSAIALLAYPLLALQVTGSASGAGLVMATGMIVQLAVGLPGGVLIDRVDKRKLMLLCDGIRALAQVGLWLAIVTHHGGLTALIAAVIVDNALTSVFTAAEPTAVRHVVSEVQLPVALARIEARDAAALLAGPPLGGLLLTVGAGWPFAANAVSYAVSFFCIVLMRASMPPAGKTARGVGWRSVTEGLGWIWRQPFVRVTLLLISGSNLVSNSLLLVAIVVCRQHGNSAAAIGLLFTFAGTGSVIGALLAPTLVRKLTVRTILIANRCLWVLLVLPMLVVTDAYAVGVLLGLMFLMGPTGTTAVRVKQMGLTPDELQGRVSSARSFCTGVAAPIGTTAIGFTLQHAGTGPAVVALAMWLAAMAAIAVTSRDLKVT